MTTNETIMKSLNQYIKEKLIINKDYRDNKIVVKSFDELRNIIEDRYDKFGAGTKQDPIDFNDIDVSNLNSFSDNDDNGLFEKTKFKYIDISDWDVSSVTNMLSMFYRCNELKSVGDISYWNVSNVTNMAYMFTGCANLNQDISRWIVSRVTDMSYMFYNCVSFNQDISEWDVSKVIDMNDMFYNCESFNQDLSNWDVSKVKFKTYIFENCPIKEEYKPKFK